MDSDLGSWILFIYMKMIFRMINPRHIKESLVNVKFFNSLPYAAFPVSNYRPIYVRKISPEENGHKRFETFNSSGN